MSKHLHPTIIEYFQSRMTDHSRVDTFDNISTEEFFIYRISRKGGLSPVVVWLSDAYHFTKAEYLARPKRPKPNYILIARPEATDSEPVSEDWDGIGVGNIAGFMGALNKSRVCTYSPPKRTK
ncbi:MAG: hypothetical protein HYX79_02485 [Chloroflexi bacterium]|nr:hypothetical protein [Chloroflexota bacterium]